MQRLSNISRLRNKISVYTFKHDINNLLNLFTSIDHQNIGAISLDAAKLFFNSIGIHNPQKILFDYQSTEYEFDYLLSIIGNIQQPEESSIYVIEFVRLLTDFKKERIKQDEQNGFYSAKQIDEKIKNIVENQIQRKIQQIQSNNQKIIDQLIQSQNLQLQKFKDQQKSKLEKFQNQKRKKFHQSIDVKNKSIEYQQSRIVSTSRKRYSVLTSIKLIQLEQKKKRFVQQSKYDQALLMKQKIIQQKEFLKLKQQKQAKFIATRHFESLNKKKESFLQTTIMLAQNDFKIMRLKMKQEQQIMKIRFNKIRKEKIKKLDLKIKEQILKLKSLFYEATKR